MCGACCRIKDGIVRVSDAEIARIAAFLGMGEAEFIEREAEVAPDRKSLVLKSRPDGSCAYLTEDNLCRINLCVVSAAVAEAHIPRLDYLYDV